MAKTPNFISCITGINKTWDGDYEEIMLRAYRDDIVAEFELENLERNLEFDFGSYELTEIQLERGFAQKMFYLVEIHKRSKYIHPQLYKSSEDLKKYSKRWNSFLSTADIVDDNNKSSDSFTTLEICSIQIDISGPDEYSINCESEFIEHAY